MPAGGFRFLGALVLRVCSRGSILATPGAVADSTQAALRIGVVEVGDEGTDPLVSSGVARPAVTHAIAVAANLVGTEAGDTLDAIDAWVSGVSLGCAVVGPITVVSGLAMGVVETGGEADVGGCVACVGLTFDGASGHTGPGAIAESLVVNRAIEAVQRSADGTRIPLFASSTPIAGSVASAGGCRLQRTVALSVGSRGSLDAVSAPIAGSAETTVVLSVVSAGSQGAGSRCTGAGHADAVAGGIATIPVNTVVVHAFVGVAAGFPIGLPWQARVALAEVVGEAIVVVEARVAAPVQRIVAGVWRAGGVPDTIPDAIEEVRILHNTVAARRRAADCGGSVEAASSGTVARTIEATGGSAFITTLVFGVLPRGNLGTGSDPIALLADSALKVGICVASVEGTSSLESSQSTALAGAVTGGVAAITIGTLPAGALGIVDTGLSVRFGGHAVVVSVTVGTFNAIGVGEADSEAEETIACAHVRGAVFLESGNAVACSVALSFGLAKMSDARRIGAIEANGPEGAGSHTVTEPGVAAGFDAVFRAFVFGIGSQGGVFASTCTVAGSAEATFVVGLLAVGNKHAGAFECRQTAALALSIAGSVAAHALNAEAARALSVLTAKLAVVLLWLASSAVAVVRGDAVEVFSAGRSAIQTGIVTCVRIARAQSHINAIAGTIAFPCEVDHGVEAGGGFADGAR